MDLDPDDDAASIDYHHFVIIIDELNADDGTRGFRDLVVFHALSTAVVEREFSRQCAFSIAVLGSHHYR